MVIDDAYLFRPGIRPAEDNAPLVIDTNGMKARERSPQSFQAVAGRDDEVAESTGLIHLNEFSQGNPRDRRKAAAFL